jgi:hypothetical protein
MESSSDGSDRKQVVPAIAFGDRLPGVIAPVRRAEVEISPGSDPVAAPQLWVAAVGPPRCSTGRFCPVAISALKGQAHKKHRWSGLGARDGNLNGSCEVVDGSRSAVLSSF